MSRPAFDETRFGYHDARARDGSRRRGNLLSRHGDPSEDDLEEQLVKKQALRRRLLRLLPEQELDLALALEAGQVTLAEIARAAGLHPYTVTRDYQRFKARLRRALLADAIQAALPRDDFTLDPRTARFLAGHDAWSVAVPGSERRFPHLPEAEAVTAYLSRHGKSLADPSTFVSGWQDATGEYCLGLSRLYPRADRAAA
jgi:hypothetical protein